MTKVLIVAGNSQYRRLFEDVLGFEITSQITEANVVCFTGGEDVSTDLYGDEKHQATSCNPARDDHELEIFTHCVQNGIPMVGICRGAQFLNVASGGRMYQHVGSHAIAGTHLLVDLETGEPIPVTSTHHQMMMPHEEANVLAIATLGGFREWYDGNVAKRDTSNTDYEVVYYPGTRCLCFQPHPEFGGEEYAPMKQYFKRLVNQYLEI